MYKRQLLERNSFQYSYAQDPLYRQYAQQYTQHARNAKMCIRDSH